MRTMLSPPGMLHVMLLLVAALLAGCGGGAMTAMSPTAAPAAPADMSVAMAPTAAPAATAVPVEATGGYAQENAPGVPITQAPPTGDASRKIIKDAQIAMEVANIDLALSRINGIAAQSQGYILETNTNYSIPTQRQATVRIGVPVDQFEVTLQRLREGAAKILSEMASGVDVTQEFVDVQSQNANLEATQARVREFLNQAQNVEQALKVNAQLTEIEGQLSQLKGRLQFLSQRAAYSTITIALQEPPPPAPTPMPTPTPEPIWNPEKTTAQATNTLTTIVQVIATVLLWLGIVVVPIALPIILLVIVVRYIRRRRGGAAEGS
jgi:hypothetical protein